MSPWRQLTGLLYTQMLRPERGGKDFRRVQTDDGKGTGDSKLSDHAER